MILIRNIFHLKYGKAKEAKAIMKQLRVQGGIEPGKSRVLTDITGRYYTMVLEITSENLGTMEAEQSRDLGNPALGPLFGQFSELVESGHREIFTIVE